jgi:hypothetical protein
MLQNNVQSWSGARLCHFNPNKHLRRSGRKKGSRPIAGHVPVAAKVNNIPVDKPVKAPVDKSVKAKVSSKLAAMHRQQA